MSFGWKKTIIYSLLPVLMLFALLETGARIAEIWMPPLNTDFGLGFDPGSRVFIPSEREPGFLITNPPKELSFHRQRFAVPKPPKVFRVFMLGGSSVNYLMVDLTMLAFRLTAQFHGQRAFEFIDCGGLAFGTHRLLPLLCEVLNYDPDMILFYEGHNEFEELEQLRLANLSTLHLQKVLYKSALARFIRDRIASVQIAQLKKQRHHEILADATADWSSGAGHRYTQEEIAERMAAYRNNLSIMISMCKNRNIPFIIGTVPSNLWLPDLPDPDAINQIREHYGKGEFEAGVALARERLKNSSRHQASDTENGIIRGLAKEYGIPLADVETAVIAAEPHRVPGETLFNDRCHLNDEGNKILIKLYEAEVVKWLRENVFTK